MVADQVEARGVRDPRVLAAMRHVPREAFVPEALRDKAFADSALALTHGQTISQPYIVATMCAALELRPSDRVLEVGTGSGYGAAVLAELAGEVFTVERVAALAWSAAESLKRTGAVRVRVCVGDGSVGWPPAAPFDAIAVTAAGPVVPTALRQQLALGGRLVMPVGPDGAQRLLRLRRGLDGEWTSESLGAVRFVPLLGAQGHPLSGAD